MPDKFESNVKDAISKAFDRPNNKPIQKAQPVESAADKRSVIVTGNMNQQPQGSRQSNLRPVKSSVAVNQVASASNGFNQVNKKQYGVNAVPTSRRAQLAGQYGQQKQVKKGDADSWAHRQPITKPSVRALAEPANKVPPSQRGVEKKPSEDASPSKV